MTKPEIKVRIDEAELLLGRRGSGLYAFEGPPPISAGRRTIGGLGRSSSAEVVVPEAAAGAFHKPPPTGVINLVRRGAGVRVAPGSVDLATGRFIAWKGAGKYDWFLETPDSEPPAIDPVRRLGC